MGKKSILFICGSVGLGHVTRDVAIADELRKANSDIEISWLAAPPARDYLLEKKEKLLQEAYSYPEETQIMESISEGYKINLFNYTMNVLKAWNDSFELFKNTLITHRILISLSNCNLNKFPCRVAYQIPTICHKSI